MAQSIVHRVSHRFCVKLENLESTPDSPSSLQAIYIQWYDIQHEPLLGGTNRWSLQFPVEHLNIIFMPGSPK